MNCFYLLLFLYQQKTINAASPIDILNEKTNPDPRPLTKWQEKMLLRQRDYEMGRVDENGNVLQNGQKVIIINKEEDGLQNKEDDLINEKEPLILRLTGPLSDELHESRRMGQSYQNWRKPKLTKRQDPEDTRSTRTPTPSQREPNSRPLLIWPERMLAKKREYDKGKLDKRRNVLQSGTEHRRFDDSWGFQHDPGPEKPADLPDRPWIWQPHLGENNTIEYYFTNEYVARDYFSNFPWRKPRSYPKSISHGTEIAVRQVADIMFRMLMGKKDPVSRVNVPDYFDRDENDNEVWPPLNIIEEG